MKDRIEELFEAIWERQPRIQALKKELREEQEKDRADLMAIKQECKGEPL